MDASILSGIWALGGTVVGGLISYFLQRQKNLHELNLMREERPMQILVAVIMLEDLQSMKPFKKTKDRRQ